LAWLKRGGLLSLLPKTCEKLKPVLGLRKVKIESQTRTKMYEESQTRLEDHPLAVQRTTWSKEERVFDPNRLNRGQVPKYGAGRKGQHVRRRSQGKAYDASGA